ncbi:prophage DNA circulation protein [Bradyrhizobium sp. USDA 4501]
MGQHGREGADMITTVVNWKRRDIAEAEPIVRRMCPVIVRTVPGLAVAAGPQFRQTVGDMSTHAADYILDGTLTHRVVISLTLARMCGATMSSLGAVRQAAMLEDPQGLIAVATKFMFASVSLAQESIASTTQTFASRDDAAQAKNVMMAAFEAVEEAVPDALDQACYMALVAMHGRLARQFYEMELLLPRVISYHYPVTYPALRMSQLVYGDATHSDELWRENKVVHPAFMPRDGIMLSTEG